MLRLLSCRNKPGKFQSSSERKRRNEKIDEAKFIVTKKCCDEIDVRCDKLETLCDTIEYGLTGDDKIQAQFYSVPEEKRDSYYRILCLFESDFDEEPKRSSGYTDMYTEYVQLVEGISTRDGNYEV